MSSSNACLQDFVELAPGCLETADLESLITLLRELGAASPNGGSQSDRLVLLNNAQYPIGVIRLGRILPHLLATRQTQAHTSEMPQTAPAHRVFRLSSTSWKKLRTAIVEPVTVLAGHLSINDFLVDRPHQQEEHYALTGDRGEYIGLLNHQRLLHFLTQPPQEETTDAGSSNPLSTIRQQKALKRQQRQMARLAQQLLIQKSVLEMKVASQRECIDQLMTYQGSPPGHAPHLPEYSNPAFLHLLQELIEYLPLPLMLQTSRGRVVAQNTTWRQQIGKLLDPNRVQQEAAELLETAPQQKLPIRKKTVRTPPTIGRGTMPGDALCHESSKAGSCVCVCPLKNGQEQVLQFSKISLHPVSPSLTQEITATVPAADTTHTTTRQTDNHPTGAFQLATLLPLSETAHSPMTLTEVVVSEAPPTAATTPSDSPEVLWLVLAEDITEQHSLARELTTKNADLVQLNRLKDEFLACISHELRTPLTAVLGLSSLLKDQTLGEMSQRQLHYAQLIYQSGRHLMAVVNDILDLTRMETGQLQLVQEPVNVITVCQRAFEQATELRLLDDRQNQSETGTNLPAFSLSIEPGLEILVADEQRLRQMLLHLLSNALKFTEPDQQIGLRVNHWGGWIAFTVWDTGLGIPADKQHLIFQKFQQLENPLTRRFEGTGLGLVLTQRLARLHGGDVTFMSKEGQGTQFTILLPPTPPGQTSLTNHSLDEDHLPYPSGLVPPQLRGESALWEDSLLAMNRHDRLVLVVEVVPQFIESLSDQLVGLGYRVVVARSGTEAVEKARRLQPCIIFLNPILPLLSGWDVLTLLKSKPETRPIPVVMMATQIEDAPTLSYTDGWLSLPIQPKALQQVLLKLMAQSRQAEDPAMVGDVITVLCLDTSSWTGSHTVIPPEDLPQLLQYRRYRVLIADDLEQAEMLARVWKPNVVLLDGTLTNPAAYFEQFSQHTCLASLPLVTLDPDVTQAANQVVGLLVFPCLTSLSRTPSFIGEDLETSALVQVIQVAAGYAWKPAILALDLASLPLTLDLPLTHDEFVPPVAEFPYQRKWLQALVQYLQTAGLRGVIGRSWQEVVQQVQSQSIDLLLVCWTEESPSEATLHRLNELEQIETTPPILLLDHRASGSGAELPPLPEAIQMMMAEVLPPTTPMADLLDMIHQLLKG